MPDRQRTQILCLDDEPNVLEGLSMHLQRHHDVFTATNGLDALELLRQKPQIAVVISDMRMPQMDGATFLGKAKQVAPQAVRILLTGQTELETAISAVNDGQLFRFLTKPCPPTSLMRAVDDAIEQHRLVTAERILLEQTVHGSIKALTDVLALVDPVSFGRANRIKRLVVELCTQLGIQERWHIEVAAMLSQLGHMTLPAETVQKLERGDALDAHEQKMLTRLPTVIDQMIGSIPRLEPVRELLSGALREPPARPLALSAAGQPQKRQTVSVLRVAIDYDQLESKGVRPPELLVELRKRAERYDIVVLDALASLRDRANAGPSARWVAPSDLKIGMVFAEDIRSKTGILLAARGFEVTEGFIERVRNLRAGSVPERVYIY